MNLQTEQRRENYLYYGDNLEILRDKIADNSVDLCYIDPPFNSKRNYNQIYNNIGKEDRAQTLAFTDTWEWDEAAIDGMNQIQGGRFPARAADLLAGLQKVLGNGSLLAYLVSMTLRINEIYRVLKPTGSFFLHCDPTASHYLKLVLDAVFCSREGEFLNEIAWCYGSGGASKRHFSKKHDIIFWYSRGKDYFFYVDAVREPYSSPEKSMTPKVSSSGKQYTKMNPLGRIPFDWWQIPILTNSAKERLGYPTQKPAALLKRIIQAATDKDAVVLDCYCGCGTTIDAAQELGRRWIGVDITYNSIALIEERLKNAYGGAAKYTLIGVPHDMGSAKALAERADKTRKEFEKWAILRYTNNRAIVNEKKGGDGGIDGRAKTQDKSGWRDVLFSVKSGNYTVDMVKAFAKTIDDKEAVCGFMIVMNPPTSGMRKIAADMGTYQGLLAKPIPRMQFVMVEDMLENRASYPLPAMTAEVLKKAVQKETASLFDSEN